MSDLINLEEAAERCGVPLRRLKCWVDACRISAVEIDGRRFVSLHAVADYQRSRNDVGVLPRDRQSDMGKT